jgi:hypothetical protein
MASNTKGADNNPQKKKPAVRATPAPKMAKQPRGKGYGGTKQTGKGKPSAGGKAVY